MNWLAALITTIVGRLAAFLQAVGIGILMERNKQLRNALEREREDDRIEKKRSATLDSLNVVQLREWLAKNNTNGVANGAVLKIERNDSDS